MDDSRNEWTEEPQLQIVEVEQDQPVERPLPVDPEVFDLAWIPSRISLPN